MQSFVPGKRLDRFGRFHEQLRLRGHASYEDYLASPEWQAFKEWYAKSSFPQYCLVCRSKEFELHHWRYEDIGQDDLHDVIPLCREHHKEIHQHCEKFDIPLNRVVRQLIGCFRFHPARAQAAFRPFLKAYSRSRKRYCPRCNRRIRMDHRFENCFDCMKEIRKEQAVLRAKNRAANPQPARAKPEKKTKPTPILCAMCNRRRRKEKLNRDGVCGDCSKTAEYANRKMFGFDMG